ncbi:uncharacterized protein [Lepeophtheirus salmonis]|uniref:uncharacterized protein n=1 Tax=Lepeophtheirus salmonis TaxID=72036 RepID=UPI003AF3A1F5
MELINSSRGGQKLIFEGFIYVKQKNLANEIISYECQMRRNFRECKAKIHISGNNHIVRRINEHTHAPDIGKANALKVRNSIKRRTEDTGESAQQILSQELFGISEDVTVNLPALPSIRRCIRRHRQQLRNTTPPLPQSRKEIVFPEIMKSTPTGDKFLIYDSGYGDEERFLIFATYRNLQILEKSINWFCDSTFQMIPTIFYQLFTIHAYLNNYAIPCVYALLPNKTQATYTRLFQEISAINPCLSPQLVTTDFEMASMNALQSVFPDVQIKGCFYHLSQSIYRKIQENGLQDSYQNNPDFNINIRMLSAIAFVPVDQTIEVFEALSETMPDIGQPIIDYFEDTYIGRLQLQERRQEPSFLHTIWNVRDRIIDGLSRNDNSVEGWYRHFQVNIGSQHPNLWEFIDILHREQSLNDDVITRMMADYDNYRTKLDFLKEIAYNIKL